jgi:hypothetical protein
MDKRGEAKKSVRGGRSDEMVVMRNVHRTYRLDECEWELRRDERVVFNYECRRERNKASPGLHLGLAGHLAENHRRPYFRFLILAFGLEKGTAGRCMRLPGRGYS